MADSAGAYTHRVHTYAPHVPRLSPSRLRSLAPDLSAFPAYARARGNGK